MTNTNTNTSISFCGLLTTLFIALKLTHVISWPWWWVVSPLWIPSVLLAVVLIVVLAAAWFMKPKCRDLRADFDAARKGRLRP
jgi:hypothetical protein